MKAWLYNGTSSGLEKNMHLDSSARVPPAPRGDEVLVQVLSSALNPADFKVPETGPTCPPLCHRHAGFSRNGLLRARGDVPAGRGV
jgi:hypothetical protein